ncbi:glycoside hydrolase [Massarina eburnea CBS 473.64]|uniref:Glycoside hydrolase n=1 Tax=Massarina eburnea CBS 473.64 TaxID=1395130 RepID=A0A6A6RWP6_9PLEO|nr:glycoside hydrolase [Massarina eburnea CBS 473.64]
MQFTHNIFQGALLAALVSSVAGHTDVTSVQIGGKTYKGFYAASKASCATDSPAWCTNQGWGHQPVMGDKINHPDIIAHKDASPSSFTAEAPAGSKVSFTWFHTGDCAAGNEVGWDCSHHGWSSAWLASCNGDCSKVDKTQLSFFKIHESGLLGYPAGTRYADGSSKEQTGKWATDVIFYDNKNVDTITLPKDIPSGNYVLRTELTSIHNNGDVSERQFWPQAFNIKVTGGSDSAKVPAGVKGTEIYKTTDPLLTFNLYQHVAGATYATVSSPKIASVASTSKRSHARDFA